MAEFRFDERVAIVTGAGRGLGRAHAKLLASRGALVVANDQGGELDGSGGDPGVAQAVVDEIEAAGGTAIADTTSVAGIDGAQAIVQGALDAFGRLDIVVNNAGILADRSVLNMAPESFDAVMDVHLRGAYLLSRAAFQQMKARRYGRIVNTSSIAGLYGNFGQTNYASAKMGLVGLTRTLAHEGAKHDIRANVIAPAAYTRMTENLMPAEQATTMRPELVSPAVAWLCHEDCRLSGEIIAAAGGRFGRIFVGETVGWYSDQPTIEGVEANLARILDTDGFTIPMDIQASTALLERAMARA